MMLMICLNLHARAYGEFFKGGIIFASQIDFDWRAADKERGNLLKILRTFKAL